MFFVCLMPVIRSYRYVLRSITPAVCRIAPNRTACDMLRSYSAVGRDRHSCVLGCRVVIRRCWFTSGLRVFWRRSRRDYRGRWVTELAARPLCVFAQPHWLCGVFRREYAGAARPRLRQRVFDSLDSPHAAAGLCWCVFAAPSPGYTERPARVQFMLGRVGLYSDHVNTLQRPDSSRPAAAARSRVACAKRCGCRHCRPRAKRCVSGHCLPLDPACRAPRAASPPDARADPRERSARGRCPWESPRR